MLSCEARVTLTTLVTCFGWQLVLFGLVIASTCWMVSVCWGDELDVGLYLCLYHSLRIRLPLELNCIETCSFVLNNHAYEICTNRHFSHFIGWRLRCGVIWNNVGEHEKSSFWWKEQTTCLTDFLTAYQWTIDNEKADLCTFISIALMFVLRHYDWLAEKNNPQFRSISVHWLFDKNILVRF